MRQLLLGTALVLLGAACGGHRQASSTTVATVAPPTTGRPFDSGLHALVTAGRGPHRVSLLVGRSRSGRLCVGADGPDANERPDRMRCLTPADREAIFVYGAFGGPSRTATSWGTIVGLARADVDRVTLETQSGRPRRLSLRRVPGLGWSFFSAAPPEGRAPPGTACCEIPDRLSAFAGDGKLADLQLSFAWEAPKGGHGRWAVVRDAGNAESGLSPADAERVRRLVFTHPLVRRLLAGRRYGVEPLAGWSKCNGGFLGGVLTVDLAAPAVWDADFPTIDFERAERRAYAESVVHYTVFNVTKLEIRVDLNRRKVVDVDPTAGDGAIVAQARQVQEPRPAGGPDASCPPARD